MNANVKVENKVRGLYRLRGVKSGITTKDTGWFGNLITNAGLDRFCKGMSDSSTFNEIRHTLDCHVGSGSTPPAPTDTTLEFQIATVEAVTVSAGFSVDEITNELVYSRTFTFINGSAAGNISEVGTSPGTGDNTNLLTSRSLVKDQSGNPTTVTILADEDLVVDYEYRIKQLVTDVTGVAGSYNFTIRGYALNAVGDGWWGSFDEKMSANLSDSSSFRATGLHTTTSLYPLTQTTRPAYADVPTSASGDTYLSGTFERTIEYFWDTNVGNGTWGLLTISHYCLVIQILFSPVIVKTDVDTLRIKVKYAWSAV